MKHIIPTFILAVSASSNLLLGNISTTNYEPRTTNYNNQGDGLDCYLMMDPTTLEEGAEALGEGLGVFGKKATSAQTSVGTIAATLSPVGNSSSSVMLSEKIDTDVVAEENATNRFLEEEICNNIYTSCLAKVATMSLAERKTAEGAMQEKEEWEAAKDMAMEEESELKIVWEKAKGETLAAQKKFDSANAILHGKAYADEAYYNWQVKELAEKLAEARVTTAHATLNAIKFRNTAQRVKSEAKLNEAIAIERKASESLEAATSNTSPSVECARESTNHQSSSNSACSSRSPLPSPAAAAVSISVLQAEARETIARVTDQIEEAKQASARARAEGKENEARSRDWEIFSLRAEKDYEAKAIEAQEAGKTQLAAGYREAAAMSQRAAEQGKLSAQTHAAGKENESYSWGGEGRSLQAKAGYQAKASEAQEAGKTTLAEGYREAAAMSQGAADQSKLSAQTCAAGKQSEGKSGEWGARSLQKKADYQAKAIEAQEAGKLTLAAGYREAAAMSQRAAEQGKLSAQAHAAGKDNEGYSWGSEGRSLQSQADYEAKAIEAQEAGKTTLAAGYREAAAMSQRAADQWKESALAMVPERGSEYTRLWKAGQATQKEADAIAKKAEEAILPTGQK